MEVSEVGEWKQEVKSSVTSLSEACWHCWFKRIGEVTVLRNHRSAPERTVTQTSHEPVELRQEFEVLRVHGCVHGGSETAAA